MPTNKKKKEPPLRHMIVKINFEGELEMNSKMNISDLEQILEEELSKQKVHFLSQLIIHLDNPFNM